MLSSRPVHIPEQLNLGPVSVAGVMLPDSQPSTRLESAPEPPTPVKEPLLGILVPLTYSTVLQTAEQPGTQGFFFTNLLELDPDPKKLNADRQP